MRQLLQPGGCDVIIIIILTFALGKYNPDGVEKLT